MTEAGEPVPPEATHEVPPPVLGSWNRMYALVIGVLILCIALFYAFARAFS